MVADVIIIAFLPGLYDLLSMIIMLYILSTFNADKLTDELNKLSLLSSCLIALF